MSNPRVMEKDSFGVPGCHRGSYIRTVGVDNGAVPHTPEAKCSEDQALSRSNGFDLPLESDKDLRDAQARDYIIRGPRGTP